MTEDEIAELFELTPKQEKAFEALKKAHKECLKAGLKFYNVYGDLGVFDKKKIIAFGDESNLKSSCRIEGAGEGIPSIDCGVYTNTFSLTCNEFADDDGSHYFFPKLKK